MAYSDTALSALVQSGGFTFWRYVTTDSRATVAAAGYFATAAAKLRAGDLMLLQAADAMALLPVRSGPTLGPGNTLDGVVGPIATVRNIGFSFTVAQSITNVVRAIALTPLAAGIVGGSSIPVSAKVTGAISAVVFGVRTLDGVLVQSEVTAPVVNGTANAILAAPPEGSTYRIRASDAANPGLAANSLSFTVGQDLQFILLETDGHLLIEAGNGLKQN